MKSNNQNQRTQNSKNPTFPQQKPQNSNKPKRNLTKL